MQRISLIALATLFLGMAPSVVANPLFDGADPDILVRKDHTYWVYPTTEGEPKKALYAHKSEDLVHWTTVGPVLETRDINWIYDDKAPSHELWAPGIFRHRHRFFLFYAVGPQNPTPSRIGVAMSGSPAGKFIDSGKPLITGDKDFEAIDPMVFNDPTTKKIYLYCGGSAGTKMHVYELNDNCFSIKKQIDVETPQSFTEAPFMHFRDGTYYLSYSHGKWDSNDYSVHYSKSTSPLGPWKYCGEILKTDSHHAGPGHHAFAKDPTTGKWYIIYHRWDKAILNGKMPAVRSVSIDAVEYDKNGLILPIVMTD